MQKERVPESQILKARVLAAWRTRASAASICVGAQVFLFGSGIAMPLCLNSAWLSSLASLPAAALITLCCRSSYFQRYTDSSSLSKEADHPKDGGRLFHILLALTLTANAILALVALLSLAEQTLLPQTRAIWSGAATLSFVLLCALSGNKGVSRLCFALRFLLPAALLLLTAASVPLEIPVGLFPILGAGPLPLGVACACMLSASSPVLMLLLPPPELEQIEGSQDRRLVPGIGFFLRRVLLGAGFGCLLLFALSVCGTYESIAAQQTWGERLRILCSGQPHEGIPQALLTVCQLSAIALLAVNMLCAGEQALVRAIPKLLRMRAGLLLLTALCAACLFALIVFGLDMVLFTAPGLILPSALCLILSRKKKEANT